MYDGSGGGGLKTVNVTVPIQILACTANNKTYYYAYKELRKGDTCELATGDTIAPASQYIISTLSIISREPYLAFTEKEATSSAETLAYSDLQAAGFSEVLPILKHYSTLNNVNASMIRKYLTSDAKSLTD